MVGGVGYYVYNSQQDKKATTSDVSKEATKESVEETAQDPTTGWKTYTEPGGRYEFKHPATWTFAASPADCSDGLTLFGANKEATGICASDGAGQMSISLQDGDVSANYQLTAESYPDLKTETVMVSGVSAKKQTGTYQSAEPVFIGPEVGDKRLVYIIVKNGKTIVASYDTRTTNPYPDVRADFETLVTKTLKLKI